MTPISKKYTFMDGTVITGNKPLDIFTQMPSADAFDEPLTDDYLLEAFNKEGRRRLQLNGKVYEERNA